MVIFQEILLEGQKFFFIFYKEAFLKSFGNSSLDWRTGSNISFYKFYAVPNEYLVVDN